MAETYQLSAEATDKLTKFAGTAVLPKWLGGLDAKMADLMALKNVIDAGDKLNADQKSRLQQAINRDPDAFIASLSAGIDKNPALLSEAIAKPSLLMPFTGAAPVASVAKPDFLTNPLNALIGSAAAGDLPNPPVPQIRKEETDKELRARLAGDAGTVRVPAAMTPEGAKGWFADRELELYPPEKQASMRPRIVAAIADPAVSGPLLNQLQPATPASSASAPAATAVPGDETAVKRDLVTGILKKYSDLGADPNINEILKRGKGSQGDPEIAQMIKNVAGIDVNEDPDAYIARLSKMSVEELRLEDQKADEAMTWKDSPLLSVAASAPQGMMSLASKGINSLYGIFGGLMDKNGSFNIANLANVNIGAMFSQLSSFMDQFLGQTFRQIAGSESLKGANGTQMAQDFAGSMTRAATGAEGPAVQAYDGKGNKLSPDTRTPVGPRALVPGLVANGPAGPEAA